MFFRLFTQFLAPSAPAPVSSYHPIDTFDEDAIVTSTIYPGNTGRVYFKSTWWFARCTSNITIPSRTFVRVVARQNLTLVVEPTEMSYCEGCNLSIFEQ